MDSSTLLLGIPFFFLIFQATSLLTNKKRLSLAGKRKSSNVAQKAFHDSMRAGTNLRFNVRILQNRKFRERLELLLLRSGNPKNLGPQDILLFKELMVLAMAMFLWLMDASEILIWVVALPASFFVPDYILRMQGSARKVLIQRNVPGFVDLLALTMESGMDLMAAVEKIMEKMRDTPLRNEMQTLLQESRLGTPRKEALQHLAFRTDLSDVQSLTSMIIQSEELGSSLSLVLRTFAEDMRAKRILRAEEAAGKAPVKILMPMVVFFMPIVFIIILGPLALSFISGTK